MKRTKNSEIKIISKPFFLLHFMLKQFLSRFFTLEKTKNMKTFLNVILKN